MATDGASGLGHLSPDGSPRGSQGAVAIDGPRDDSGRRNCRSSCFGDGKRNRDVQAPSRDRIKQFKEHGVVQAPAQAERTCSTPETMTRRSQCGVNGGGR